MKVTPQNYHDFTPDELSQGIAGGHVNLLELGLEAAVGIVKLIATGIDNGPRGRRIKALQESDLRTAQVLDAMLQRIKDLENKIDSLQNQKP